MSSPHSLPRLCASAFILAVCALPAPAQDTDLYGDPLPQGAVQRLGSLRLKYGGISDAQYLPDGRVLVLSGATLDVLDMSAGTREAQHKLPFGAVSLQVGQDGHTLLLAGSGGQVLIYDLAQEAAPRTWPTGQAGLRKAAFSPDETRMLTVGRMPPTLKEWDLATGAELVAMTGQLRYFDTAAYYGDGRRAIAGGGYHGLEAWDLDTGQLIKQWKSDYCAYDLVISADGRRALVGERHRASEWDLEEYKLLNVFSGHHGHAVTAQGYSSNPDELFTGSRDGSVRRWNRLEAKVLHRWSPHSAYARLLRVSPDGKWVLSHSTGQYLTESGCETGEPRLSIKRHSSSVDAVAWVSDDRVLSGSVDGTARVWDAESGECLLTLSAGLGASCVAAAGDGNRLAVGGKDSTIREYDANGEPARELKGHRGYVRALQYLPDGRLASSADDGTVRIWGAAPEPDLTLTGHRGGVLALAVVNETRLASAGRDGTVRLWDLAGGAQLWGHQGHAGYVTCLAPGAPGTFHSSGRDGQILTWDLDGGSTEAAATGAWNHAVSAARDGSRIWAGNANPRVLTWDAEGKPLPALAGHVAGCTGLALSPGGTRLASASEDGTLLIWPAAP